MVVGVEGLERQPAIINQERVGGVAQPPYVLRVHVHEVAMLATVRVAISDRSRPPISRRTRVMLINRIEREIIFLRDSLKTHRKRILCSSDEASAMYNVNARLGHVETLLVIADQTTIAHRTCKRPLDESAPRLHLEAPLALQVTYNFDGEVETGSLVQQRTAVVGHVAEQMLHPSA